MSTLIPNSQLKELNITGRPCEVFDGNTYLGTWIPANPHDGVVADRIRTQAEYLGAQSNSIYPLEVDSPKPVVPEDKRLAALEKGRAVLKAKRAAALAVA